MKHHAIIFLTNLALSNDVDFFGITESFNAVNSERIGGNSAAWNLK